MPNFLTIIILYPFIGEVFLFSDLHFDVLSHILDIHDTQFINILITMYVIINNNNSYDLFHQILNVGNVRKILVSS